MQLTIDGETFRVEVEGPEDKPAVMLSPSLGSDLSLFDSQISALLGHFRVVRYDPRGHGASSSGGAPYSLAQLGRDALAILDALAIETAHFVGISMGGAVGQWLLVNAPQRIGRAVLANTTARFGAPPIWNTRITTVCAHGTQALASATMERWFSPAFLERSPERVATVDAVFRKTSSEGYAGACSALRDMDMREAIRGIAKPVLIVSGREDPVASEEDVALLTRGIRGARHVALDCRHLTNIEQDGAFNEALVGFLTTPLSTRAPRKPPAPRRAATRRATSARRPLKPTSATPGTKRQTPANVTQAKTARGATNEPATAKSKKAKTSKPRRTPQKATAQRPVRKATTVRATPRTAASKVTANKTAAKKTTTKATTAKKVSAKKTAAKKTIAKRAVAKKTIAKKTPAKTATAKKTTAKKAVARRLATTRRAAPKRPSRASGRKR